MIIYIIAMLLIAAFLDAIAGYMVAQAIRYIWVAIKCLHGKEEFDPSWMIYDVWEETR